jgi:CheY-like chemotaxis protein
MDSGTNGTALIVDDQEEIRNYLGELLSGAQFEVLYAADGARAIQILKEHPGISLLVCDILMPEIDGLEVLSESLRLSRAKEFPRPKTILMSGGGAYESGKFYLQSTRLLGADLTLTKPFGATEFLAAIKKMGFKNASFETSSDDRPAQ